MIKSFPGTPAAEARRARHSIGFTGHRAFGSMFLSTGREVEDGARGNLDRHGVHFLIAYVAGV